MSSILVIELQYVLFINNNNNNNNKPNHKMLSRQFVSRHSLLTQVSTSRNANLVDFTLGRQRLNRLLTSSSSSSSEQPPKQKGLLYRMAPPKGGTDPPDAKFLAVASVVCVAGYYAWFIDPPKEQQQ